ncbi:MAG: sigma 54-interacting transcriptional regulator [Acidobacteria bacterium]|nr:sigma 54-interacting transcriptional regulator [Acidobacteriota bacterium]
MIPSPAEKYRLLLMVSEAANAQLDLGGVLSSVAGVLRPVVDVDAILIVTTDGQALRPHAIHIEGVERHAGEDVLDAVARALEMTPDAYDARFGRTLVRAGSGTERVGETGRADVCQDLAANRRYPEDDRLVSHGVRAYVRTPLIVRAGLIGSITFARLRDRRFTDEEVEVLEEVTRPIAGAVANALAYDEIGRLKNRLQEENHALRRDLDEQFMLDDIIGSSPALRAVVRQVEKVAPTDSTVLITGETGTGKELVARAIHRRSKRAARPMIKANLAALPDALIASELFGHEKGAFTGAVQRHIGRFELASSGTLFLDEIGELPPDMQVTLLRVLQEGEFERVGGVVTLRTDARVIAATNRDLEADVASGRFRSDLFYRLNVFPLRVPPLRERREDIPVLIEYFAARHGTRLGRRFRDVKRSVFSALVAYDWPGNVRELENAVERAAILSDGDTLRFDGLSWDTARHAQDAPDGLPVAPRPVQVGPDGAEDDRRRRDIERALRASRGRVSGGRGAATRLGIPASTLESRIRRLGIDKFRFRSA